MYTLLLRRTLLPPSLFGSRPLLLRLLLLALSLSVSLLLALLRLVLSRDVMPHVLQESLVLVVSSLARISIRFRLLVVLAQVHHALGVLVAHLVGQHLDDRALVDAQVLGHLHLELDAQVALAAAAVVELLHAHAGEGDLVACAGTGGDFDADVAVEGWDGDFAAQDCGCEGDGSCVEDVGAVAGEFVVGRHADEDVEVALLCARTGVCRLAGGRVIALAHHAQTHAVLYAAGDVDCDCAAVSGCSVAVASTTLAALGSSSTRTTTSSASARHLEALHIVYTRARAVANLTLALALTLLQTAAGTSLALHQRCDSDVLLHTLGCIHERDVRLHLNVLSNHNLLLERVSARPSPPRTSTSTKRIEQILKVEIRTETTTPRASESTAERTSTTEWISSPESSTRSSSTALVKRRGSKLVVLRFFVGVRQEFVGGLRFAELLLRTGVGVGVRVVLLREAVVRFLDLAGGRGFAYAESLVRVFHGEGWCGSVESAALGLRAFGVGPRAA